MNTKTTSSNLRVLIAAALVGAVISSFSAVCAAAENGGTFSEAVKYDDLNLSSPKGAATLYGRIVAAAYRVCGSDDYDSRALPARWKTDKCVHQAIADSVTKLGRPEVIAVYNANNRQPLPITVASVQGR